MKLVRISDLHWLHLEDKTHFLNKVKSFSPDGIVLTGDIAEADTFIDVLWLIHDFFNVPTYFNLGNHDFYRGSFEYCDTLANTIELDAPNDIIYLNKKRIKINNTTILGVNGFADGRCGDIFKSSLFSRIADFKLIGNFIGEFPNRDGCLKIMQEYADDGNKYIEKELASCSGRVVIFTHVPPFSEVHVSKEGENNDGFPFFTNQLLGDIIIEAVKKNNLEVEVYCGHTHRKCVKKVYPFIEVSVSGSNYSCPEIEEIFV